MISLLKCGPGRYTEAGHVVFSRYVESGAVAIEIHGAEGVECRATVNLWDGPPVGEHQVWLKGWSENEGIPQALQVSGIVKLTGRKHPTGYVEAELADLTEAAISEMRRQENCP